MGGLKGYFRRVDVYVSDYTHSFSIFILIAPSRSLFSPQLALCYCFLALEPLLVHLILSYFHKYFSVINKTPINMSKINTEMKFAQI